MTLEIFNSTKWAQAKKSPPLQMAHRRYLRSAPCLFSDQVKDPCACVGKGIAPGHRHNLQEKRVQLLPQRILFPQKAWLKG